MSNNLSGDIEAYLKALLRETEEGILEIQRRILSEHFSCVPSQINYVLNTRFTPENGYIVESKRGGGGYVRIVAVPIENKDDLQVLMTHLGDALSEKQGEQVLDYLAEEGLMPPDEVTLFKSLFKEQVFRPMEQMNIKEMRAHMLRHLLTRLIYFHDFNNRHK